jgi:hypothetical protein
MERDMSESGRLSGQTRTKMVRTIRKFFLVTKELFTWEGPFLGVKRQLRDSGGTGKEALTTLTSYP